MGKLSWCWPGSSFLPDDQLSVPKGARHPVVGQKVTSSRIQLWTTIMIMVARGTHGYNSDMTRGNQLMSDWI